MLADSNYYVSAALQQSVFSNLESSSNPQGMVKTRGLQLKQAFFLRGPEGGGLLWEGCVSIHFTPKSAVTLQTPEDSVQLSDFGGVKDRDYAVMQLLPRHKMQQHLEVLKGGSNTPITLNTNKSI